MDYQFYSDTLDKVQAIECTIQRNKVRAELELLFAQRNEVWTEKTKVLVLQVLYHNNLVEPSNDNK